MYSSRQRSNVHCLRGRQVCRCQAALSALPENALHLLALAGGWPGALLAQQFLRHKSTKQEFRQVFWVTVLLNIIALVLLATPLRRMLPGAQ